MKRTLMVFTRENETLNSELRNKIERSKKYSEEAKKSIYNTLTGMFPRTCYSWTTEDIEMTFTEYGGAQGESLDAITRNYGAYYSDSLFDVIWHMNETKAIFNVMPTLSRKGETSILITKNIATVIDRQYLYGI